MPDCKHYPIKVGSRDLDLRLWDTAGQEKYRAISESYYNGARGAFIVTAVNEPEAEKQVIDWLRSVKKRGPQDIPVVILFNKIDLESERAIQKEAIPEIIEQLKGKAVR